MSHPSIVVIGSSNTDMVIRSEYLPKPGETILGGNFLMNPGGKGANQAVAAAKLGGKVTLITKVGNDIFGREALNGFVNYGIDTTYIQTDELSPSGVALIMVDESGENCISVAPGANSSMLTQEIDLANNAIIGAGYLLLQLEVPLSIVEYATAKARQAGVKVILNPAPAQELSETLLRSLYLITPNETEAELLTNIKVTDIPTARQAARKLRSKGVQMVVITMGAQGAYLCSDNLDELIPSPEVKAVDTTAAGDCFNGALTVALAEGMTLSDAVRFANKVGAYSVTKIGAQSSAPTRDEIT